MEQLLNNRRHQSKNRWVGEIKTHKSSKLALYSDDYIVAVTFSLEFPLTQLKRTKDTGNWHTNLFAVIWFTSRSWAKSWSWAKSENLSLQTSVCVCVRQRQIHAIYWHTISKQREADYHKWNCLLLFARRWVSISLLHWKILKRLISDDSCAIHNFRQLFRMKRKLNSLNGCAVCVFCVLSLYVSVGCHANQANICWNWFKNSYRNRLLRSSNVQCVQKKFLSPETSQFVPPSSSFSLFFQMFAYAEDKRSKFWFLRASSFLISL